MSAVSDERAKEVCKFGQGEATCAFIILICGEGFECAKGTDIETIIRDRLAEGRMKAKGDNCGGIDANTKNPSAVFCLN